MVNVTICLFLLGKPKENTQRQIVKLKWVYDTPCCSASLFSGFDSCFATWCVHPPPPPRAPSGTPKKRNAPDGAAQIRKHRLP